MAIYKVICFRDKFGRNIVIYYNIIYTERERERERERETERQTDRQTDRQRLKLCTLHHRAHRGGGRGYDGKSPLDSGKC